MKSTRVIEFIQEVSRPLNAKIFWDIDRRNIKQYVADIDAMRIAFEINLSECFAAEESYIKQLPEIKDRLSEVLKTIQRKRSRYEFAVKEYTNELNNLLSPNSEKHSVLVKHNPSRKEQNLKDKINHIQNIIAQFKLVLEPNIKKAIKHIDKKLKEQKDKEAIVIVEVTQEDSVPISKTNAPFYRDVKYKKEVLGDIYVIVVREGILKDTGQQDFEYYFSGLGESPNKKLMKQDKITWAELIAFIKEIMLVQNAKHIWNTSEKVFAGAQQTTLRVTYNRDGGSVDYNSFKKRLQNLLKDIPTK